MEDVESADCSVAAPAPRPAYPPRRRLQPRGPPRAMEAVFDGKSPAFVRLLHWDEPEMKRVVLRIPIWSLDDARVHLRVG